MQHHETCPAALPDMSLSAASAASILLHALVLTTILLATAMVCTTASVPVIDHRRDDVNTTMFTNGSSAVTSTGAENWEMYYCFLCTGRHPLLIHYCPIYWDYCHLNCWDAIPDAPAPPAPPVPPSSVGSPPANPTAVQGQDCYVMKLYMSGRYVIVQHVDCAYVGRWACFLTCGGGELAEQNVAMGGTAVRAPATTAAIQQGSFLPPELCNSQLNALRAPPSAGVVVVPAAGGAH